MSLQARLSALITAVGADIKEVKVLRGTVLPLIPFDGQVFDLVVDATKGIVQRYRWNAGSLSAFKWEFIGGSAQYDHIGDIGSAAQSTSSTAYVDLTTVGPSVTLPYPGDYMVEYSFQGRNSVAHSQCRATPVATNLAAAAVNAAWSEQPVTGDFIRASRFKRFDDISGTLKLQYAAAVSGTADFIARDLKATPIRIRNTLVP